MAASPPGVDRRLGPGDPEWEWPSGTGVVMKVSSPDLVLAKEGVPMSVPVAGDGDADAGADAIPSVMAALAWLLLLLPFGWRDRWRRVGSACCRR